MILRLRLRLGRLGLEGRSLRLRGRRPRAARASCLRRRRPVTVVGAPLVLVIRGAVARHRNRRPPAGVVVEGKLWRRWPRGVFLVQRASNTAPAVPLLERGIASRRRVRRLGRVVGWGIRIRTSLRRWRVRRRQGLAVCAIERRARRYSPGNGRDRDESGRRIRGHRLEYTVDLEFITVVAFAVHSVRIATATDLSRNQSQSTFSTAPPVLNSRGCSRHCNTLPFSSDSTGRRWTSSA